MRNFWNVGGFSRSPLYIKLRAALFKWAIYVQWPKIKELQNL